MAERRHWVVQFQERHHTMDFGNDNFWKKRCIYRVPKFIRNRNTEAYDPHFVSFGPYHHGEPQLMPVEEHKVRAIIHLLKKSEKPMIMYVNSLEEVVEDLMDSYDQLDYEWRDRDKFLELMFHDGCFLLEILRTCTNEKYGYYTEYDAIFSTHGNIKIGDVILEDMLKIENQVPLLVLYKLVAVDEGKTWDESIKYINDLMVEFLNNVETFIFEVKGTDLGSNTYLNMLDLARSCMVGDMVRHVGDGCVTLMSSMVYNREAIVEFYKSDKNGLSGLTFNEEKGILYVPLINIYACTESILLNLVAFENLHTGTSHYVTSYVDCIGGLIQSVEDASAMRSQDIICTAQDSEEIVKLLRKIQNDMGFIPKFTLRHVTNPSNEYYEKRTSKWQSRFRKWRINFEEKYFDSPWSLVALLAAALLLALTIIQTVYAVLS
ncbi:UPF0481 protein At3g47200-like [Tasmannia lanceolata]|uniref:UPF0481 protein At3g47200-like n=1 Tax=Tasmannia lanceolata TaxID=3420 RepID=UPI0040633E01